MGSSSIPVRSTRLSTDRQEPIGWQDATGNPDRGLGWAFAYSKALRGSPGAGNRRIPYRQLPNFRNAQHEHMRKSHAESTIETIINAT